jgi:hypothetical protein
MDGRLWTRLYRHVLRACKALRHVRRAGRPRMYRTDEVLMVWAFAALMDWPISVTHHKLKMGATGWWLHRHWSWPGRLPSVPTLTRRAKGSDFRWLLRRVLRRARSLMGLTPTAHVVMDATLMLTGAYSRDRDSRWTCHGGKWFRGYALHAICGRNGQLLAWHVTSANVQEMKAAKRLVRQLAAFGAKVECVIADSGYDSEPLHQLMRRRLQAPLLAPVNLRGARSDTWRERQPGRAQADRLLQTAHGRMLLNERSMIERWNSWFKGRSNVSMLPYHIRRLHRVRLWVNLKLALFFVHQHLHQLRVTTAA